MYMPTGFATDAYNNVRVSLYRWKNMDGEAINSDEVWEATYTPDNPAIFNRIRNWHERKNFRMLWDHTYLLSWNVKRSITVEKVFKINRTTTYSGSTANPADDIMHNAYVLSFISDSGSTPHPLVTLLYCVTYTDN